jgi:hypothetical protein
MHADDIRSTASLRHGAYLCLQLPARARGAFAALDVSGLAARLGLRNEFDPGPDHPSQAIAYLRRVAVRGGAIDDHGLAIIHVASEAPEPVVQFRNELERLLAPNTLHVLSGVVRPTNYTGTSMHNFAFARRVLQQPGTRMPNAFLMPLSKTSDWWKKSWMERHTYFLPRYDDSGNMSNEGHALVCEPGISCVMRRAYKQEQEPAPTGVYDFINYFECADADLPTFSAICAGLRDVQRNPEWRFVLEGPTWQGRRVATWSELCA